MEFTNEITFDNKLTKNKSAKINYNGSLVRNGANSVSIVYGYGDNWSETDSKEMTKANIGFEVELKMKSYNTFNFCFRDENYNWDNNNTFNYISPLEDEVIETTTESQEETESTISSETTNEVNSEIQLATEIEVKNIEKEIAHLFDELFNGIEETPATSAEITETTIEETSSIQEFNLDALIEEILNPVISEKTTTSESSVQKIETVTKTEEKIDTETLFAELFEQEETSELTSTTLVEDILIPYYEAKEQTITSKEIQELDSMDELIETLVSNTENVVEEMFSSATEIDDRNYITPSFIPDPLENIKEEIKEIETTPEKVENTITEVTTETTEEVSTGASIEEIADSIIAAAIEKAQATKKVSDFTILENDESDEPSLLEEVKQDKINSRVEESVALSIVEEDDELIVSPRKLNKFYFLKKKIKVALYKALISIPKLFGKQTDFND